MDLGHFYERNRDFTRAEELYRSAGASRRRLLGDDPSLIWTAGASVANALIGKEQLVDTEAIFRPLAERVLVAGSVHNEHSGGVIGSLAALDDKMHEVRPDTGFDRRAEAWRAVNAECRINPRHPPPAAEFDVSAPVPTTPR